MTRSSAPPWAIYLTVLLVIFPSAAWQLLSADIRADHSLLDAPMLTMDFTVIAYSAYKISSMSTKLPERLMSVCFYVFVYIWLGLIPLYQLGTQQMSWRSVLSVAYYQLTFAVVIFGIASYQLGYTLQRNRPETRQRGIATPSITRLVIFAFFAVALAIWFGPLTTPLELLFSDREALASGLSDSGSDTMTRLMSLALMRTPIYIALLMTLWRWRLDRKNRKLLGILLAAIIPVFLVANFPTVLSRTWLGTIVTSIIIAFIMTSPRPKAAYFPLLLTVALLTLYPLAHYARSAAVDFDSTISQSILLTYSAGSFDVFAMIAQTLKYLDEAADPLAFGYQLLGPLLFWVPRSVWPGKPIGTGELIADKVGFEFTNVSAPLWSEGLINFHLPGVFLLMFVFGWFSRRLESSVLPGGIPTFQSLAVAFMSGFQFIVLRGDLMTAMTLASPFFASAFVLFCRSTHSRN